MFPAIDPSGEKCHVEPADLTPMFWTGPAQSFFWESVYSPIQMVMVSQMDVFKN